MNERKMQWVLVWMFVCLFNYISTINVINILHNLSIYVQSIWLWGSSYGCGEEDGRGEGIRREEDGRGGWERRMEEEEEEEKEKNGRRRMGGRGWERRMGGGGGGGGGGEEEEEEEKEKEKNGREGWEEEDGRGGEEDGRRRMEEEEEKEDGGYNAVLYCNRAQAELFTDQNWEALLDAKRAIVLDPTSPKAYYRYCEALYELQFVEKAVTENKFGQMLCQKSGKDIKALQTQMIGSSQSLLCRNSCCLIPDYTHMLEDRFSHHFDQGRTVKVEKISEVKGLTLENFIKAEENREKERLKRLKEEKLEEETRKRNERAKAKRKEDKKKEDQQKELARKEQAEMDSKQAMAKESNTVLGNASKAYLEGRGRQAYEGYQRAVELMSQTKKKFGGITEGDYIIVLYAHGMAALETGNPHHYLSAMEKFDQILTNHKTTRTALPYYGKALTNYKMNQFKEGLDNIEKAMRINDNFETSIETWPGTDVNIKQTESGCMTQTLSALKDNCLNPPPPGAYCRYEGCNTRHEIYFNDMYFKGYVEVLCTEHCKVDYHTNCWKKLKDIRQRNTYRDMLGGTCFTPDCFGVIDDISIYGEDGLVVSKHHSKGQQEKRKVKPSGKQNKKEKKNKKGKHKDKGQGDQSQHEQDFSDVGSHTSVQSLEHGDMVISEPSVSVPKTVTISVSDTHSEDFTEDSSPMLHQEPSYILKKEEPEPEEKKAPKTKNKKKKKEAVKVEIGFADRDDRQFYSDTNVEEFNQDYNMMRLVLMVYPRCYGESVVAN
ncbi:hypothetical protein BSL78_29882 [Apostichopus japonicus]|uniref:E3 ubiquitin-protein ligase TTC3/DZIP3 domain-containing protein n=1 Tax=Stichopus japonicus TaxID=307972 RepID=A0A2G8JC36_STIJA|nr:hypothetical protein BSL78_29882 [Apostichopus japonicus]